MITKKYIFTFTKLKQDQFEGYKIIQLNSPNEIPEILDTIRTDIDVYLFVPLDHIKTKKQMDYICELCDLYCLKRLHI